MLLLDVSAGAIIVDVSVVVAVESELVVLELLLQAANVPMAKTINSFFIVCVFCDVIFVM
jgi:hypothetical protein